MNCFYHSSISAVGICKNCNRGLCSDCVTEVENGLACKGRCEKAVLLINEMIERNAKVYEKTATTYAGLAWAMALFGSVPLSIGLFSLVNNRITFAITNLIFATFFLFGAFVCFRAAKQIRSKD